MDIENIVQRFKILDLTEYQARVLYALLKNKSSAIAEISKVSEVPNTRVYDIIKQLISMDYVIQISDKPKLYRVRNVEQVLDNLLEKKEMQIKDIRTEFDNIKAFFKDDNIVNNNKLIKVTKEADLIKVLNEELLNANKSIHGFSHLELNNKNLINTLNKVVDKNIDLKLIGHTSCGDAKSLFFNNIKLQDHNLSAYLIDDNKLIMKLSKHNDELHHMSIMHGHDGFKDMLKTYFNSKWNQMP